MKKQIFFTCIAFSILITAPLHANIIWPALFVSSAIFSSWFLIAISVVIEGLIFQKFIQNLSYKKAMLMSLIGNFASATVGSIIMMLFMVMWHLTFDYFLGGTFSIYNIIANYILMCLGSSLIELGVLRLFFKYTNQQLCIPILVGNFTTYILTAIYQFPKELNMIFAELFKN